MHYLLHHLTLVEHFRTCRSEMTWKEILRCSLVVTKFNFVCKLNFKSKRRFAVMNYSGNDLWRSRTRLCHSMYDVGFTCYSKKVIKGTFGPHLILLHLKITSAQETVRISLLEDSVFLSSDYGLLTIIIYVFVLYLLTCMRHKLFLLVFWKWKPEGYRLVSKWYWILFLKLGPVGNFTVCLGEWGYVCVSLFYWLFHSEHTGDACSNGRKQTFSLVLDSGKITQDLQTGLDWHN